MLRQRIAEIEGGRFVGAQENRLTMDDLAAAIKADYATKRNRSGKRLRSALKHLERHLGHLPLKSIRHARVQRYIADRREEGAAEATIQKELAALRRGFRVLLLDERIARMPSLPVVRQMVRFGALTGWRKGEVRAMTWDMVDMDRKVLTIPGSHTKNGKPKPFPLADYPQLADLLEERWADTMAVQRRTGSIVRHVFHRYEGKRVGSIRTAWTNAWPRAGVGKVRFHDLRVYALHAMEMAGLPRSLAMTLSGHKTESVFTRYSAIFTPKELQDAATPGEPLRGVPRSGHDPRFRPECEILVSLCRGRDSNPQAANGGGF